MKRVLLTMALGAVLLFGAGSAGAIPPIQGEDQHPYDVVSWDCGDGFYLCESGLVDIRWKFFFFPNGDPKRYTEQTGFTEGIIYECANPDNFAAYQPLHFTFGYDFVREERFIHGIWALLTVPGYGQIFKDVGHIRADATGTMVTFVAGEHQWFFNEWDAVCAYLMDN